MSDDLDVAIVGGGPAGLAAAVALRAARLRVAVFEREAEVGGVPRHTDHTGYGLREFRRVLRGPAYARLWAERATRAGVDLHTSTTVTGWSGSDAADRELTLTAPTGVSEVRARAVILATGTRERPRSARLVPGTRPAGVLTTGSLQRLAHAGLPVGRRAIIVGAEHVSFSAILTLRHTGVAVAGVVTHEPADQTTWALRTVTARRYRVPILTQRRVTAIHGRARVESVELTDTSTGTVHDVECDTIVFSGDWFPDHELARRGGLAIDAGTHAPRVDGGLRTDVVGVFATGNLLHGAETASVCAASGDWVASSVTDWLTEDPGRGAEWATCASVPIECHGALRWVSPNALVPGDRSVPHGHLLGRSAEFLRRPRLIVAQNGRELWSGTTARAVPTRPLHIPVAWLGAVEPGEPIHIDLSG